jgi:hypothetical protein
MPILATRWCVWNGLANQHSEGLMTARRTLISLMGGLLAGLPILLWAPATMAQGDAYRPPRAYTPPGNDYAQAPRPYPPPGQDYSPPGAQPYDGPGQPYGRGPGNYEPSYGPGRYDGPYGPRPGRDDYPDNSYSSNEILEAGHRFFGTVTQGLAKVVEYAFQQQGRPNGYILGQDAGGAIVAGLRYGEGTLYTKDAGAHRVFWQGPSIGYDLGGDGSKVLVLVYNLRDPDDIYQRFGGVDGSAYMVGGVGLTFQKNGGIVVAPIRTGVGLRLGANIGYLKYTRAPTWNPF